MIWKERASKSNVLLFQLVASVRGINETESGLLATPNTMDHLPPRSKEGTLKLQQGHRKGRTRPSNLREQVDPQTMAMYPTPRALEIDEKIETWRARMKKIVQKGGKLPSVNLSMTVKMYPTPTAGNCMDVFQPPEYVEQNTTGWTVTRKGTGTKFGAKLNDVVHKIQNEKMYPTPLARDWKMMSYNPITNKLPIQKSIPTEVLKNNKPGGKLNPNFVEFLMGYPMNYTQIELTESKHSETQSCHKSQNKSSGVS
tara:strand:- start:721 stop:1485 length:765 start_codon:yes stop_codon:yes gene_type:complete